MCIQKIYPTYVRVIESTCARAHVRVIERVRARARMSGMCFGDRLCVYVSSSMCVSQRESAHAHARERKVCMLTREREKENGV